MGKHGAERLPARELRSSYIRLLEAYGKLLREHRRLEAEHHGLLQRVPAGAEKPRPARQTTWGRAREAMDVEAASDLIRSSGLLTSPG